MNLNLPATETSAALSQVAGHKLHLLALHAMLSGVEQKMQRHDGSQKGMHMLGQLGHKGRDACAGGGGVPTVRRDGQMQAARSAQRCCTCQIIMIWVPHADILGFA